MSNLCSKVSKLYASCVGPNSRSRTRTEAVAARQRCDETPEAVLSLAKTRTLESQFPAIKLRMHNLPG